jgi:predicted ATPase/DNA-binding CsgD family transcriptional regulator
VDRPTVEQRSDFASRRARDAVPKNLPEEFTSFVGRSAELSQARELIGEARLLTFVGAGGCGKTRLALQIAAGETARFTDGTWWVELAAVENPELLAATVTVALGLRERPGQTAIEILSDDLRDRRALLVLDNCEHLSAACAALVDRLLRCCRDLVVLATSREALRVRGELIYRVPSLTLPESESLEAVSQSDAVQLLTDRAVHARGSFAVTADNAPAVAAICRELDGMPLAIELAAARVRMLSPERIAKELDDRFRLLTGSGRSLSAHHETLRASIDWSHELCSEDERVLFRRLSVWRGGWTLDGAEAVSADEALERRAVLEALTGLVDKSLVDTEERAGEVRFRMLESIRQYATERLGEALEADATRTRHLAWCLTLAEHAEPELVRHDAGSWLRRLELEASNLRAGLGWAVASDGQAALRLAGALTLFWLMRGRLEEGSTALARAVEAAPRPSALRGKALWGLAELSIWRGQFEACLKYAEPALADGEAAGDRGVMARALKAKGLVLNLPNHLNRAPLERSIALAREAGDEWCTAEATRFLGASYVRQGEHDQARPILDDGYALARVLGHRPLYAWYFNLRAWGEIEHGRLGAARELAEQGSSVSNEVGDPVTLGMATALLIECDVLQGMPNEGRARGARCAELMRSAGVRSAQVWVENALSLAEVAEGARDAARARIEGLLRLIEKMPSYDTVSKARRRLTVVLLLLGDLDAAEAEAVQLLAHAETGRNEHVEAIARHLHGRLALARGAVMEAERHFHDALVIATRRDFRLQTLNSLEVLALVSAQTGGPSEAARLLAAVQAARKQLGVVRWPPEPELWAGVQKAVRLTLGEDAFAAAWEDGLALSVDEAAGYASRARGKRKRPARGWESLTPTELEIARHAAGGLTNPQIGEQMFITRGTVKAHLSHIYAKLNVSSRSELAAEATRRGLDARGVRDAASD